MAHVIPATGIDPTRVVIKRVYTPPCIRGCGSGTTKYSFVLNSIQVCVLHGVCVALAFNALHWPNCSQHEANGERSCAGSYKADFLTAGFSFNVDACSGCSPALNIRDAADQIIGAFRSPTVCQALSNTFCKPCGGTILLRCTLGETDDRFYLQTPRGCCTWNDSGTRCCSNKYEKRYSLFNAAKEAVEPESTITLSSDKKGCCGMGGFSQNCDIIVTMPTLSGNPARDTASLILAMGFGILMDLTTLIPRVM